MQRAYVHAIFEQKDSDSPSLYFSSGSPWLTKRIKDESDLEQLFYMIDSDKSGTVTIEEFIGPLSRWAHDSKTAPRFIKHLAQAFGDESSFALRSRAPRHGQYFTCWYVRHSALLALGH